MFGNPYAPSINVPAAQQRLAQYQQMQPVAYQQPYGMMQQPVPIGIKGRTVASLDEVKAAQIDLDGSFTYFICPADACIYAKAIDLNGTPVIQVYKLSVEKEAIPKRYADAETVEALQQKVASLERYLKGENSNANESVDAHADVSATAQ
ncbi:hypothetical protein [Phascolarctobacterium sp.]